MLQIEVYHTCEKIGEPGHVLAQAPFLSKKEGQWLSQGHYVWIGLEYLGHWWGKNRKTVHTKEYAIIKGVLEYEKDDLLDLVCEPKHVVFFKQLLDQYVKIMTQSEPDFNPTVSSCISHFLEISKTEPDTFPFKGLRVAEDDGEEGPLFIEGKKNRLVLSQRHQVCLFKGYGRMVVNKSFVHPEDWS